MAKQLRSSPGHSCGCTTGLVTMVLAIAWYVGTDVASASGPFHRIALGAATALGSAVAGKLGGMAWSRVRHHLLPGPTDPKSTR